MPAGGKPYGPKGGGFGHGRKAGGKSSNNPKAKHKGMGKPHPARNKQGGRGKGTIVLGGARKGGGVRTGAMRIRV